MLLTVTGDSLPCAAGTSAMLEAELHRVQSLVGDLQRQRQELSTQVRQLTDRSHSLSQQIHPTYELPVQYGPGDHIVHAHTFPHQGNGFFLLFVQCKHF